MFGRVKSLVSADTDMYRVSSEVAVGRYLENGPKRTVLYTCPRSVLQVSDQPPKTANG